MQKKKIVINIEWEKNEADRWAESRTNARELNTFSLLHSDRA